MTNFSRKFQTKNSIANRTFQQSNYTHEEMNEKFNEIEQFLNRCKENSGLRKNAIGNAAVEALFRKKKSMYNR
jgi:hypothetical protein